MRRVRAAAIQGALQARCHDKPLVALANPGLRVFGLVQHEWKETGMHVRTSGPRAQRSQAAASTTSRLSHPVSPVSPIALPGDAEDCSYYTAYYNVRNAKALSRLGKGLDLRKLVAGEGFEPSTSGL